MLFKYLAERSADHELIFAIQNGTPVNKRNAGHIIKRLAIACGIPPASIGLHQCRHTIATQ